VCPLIKAAVALGTPPLTPLFAFGDRGFAPGPYWPPVAGG